MDTAARSWIGAAMGLLAGVAAFEGQQVLMGHQLVIAACLAICTLTGWAVARKSPVE